MLITGMADTNSSGKTPNSNTHNLLCISYHKGSNLRNDYNGMLYIHHVQ